MSEIMMIGRELTGEQIKGFVSCEEKNGEIRIPSKWVIELCDNRSELETLRSENTILSERVKELDEIDERNKRQIEILKKSIIPIDVRRAELEAELTALKESDKQWQEAYHSALNEIEGLKNLKNTIHKQQVTINRLYERISILKAMLEDIICHWEALKNSKTVFVRRK